MYQHVMFREHSVADVNVYINIQQYVDGFYTSIWNGNSTNIKLILVEKLAQLINEH